MYNNSSLKLSSCDKLILSHCLYCGSYYPRLPLIMKNETSILLNFRSEFDVTVLSVRCSLKKRTLINYSNVAVVA